MCVCVSAISLMHAHGYRYRFERSIRTIPNMGTCHSKIAEPAKKKVKNTCMRLDLFDIYVVWLATVTRYNIKMTTRAHSCILPTRMIIYCDILTQLKPCFMQPWLTIAVGDSRWASPSCVIRYYEVHIDERHYQTTTCTLH